jgi:predicted DNA-binding ribbon-helix-helix protein
MVPQGVRKRSVTVAGHRTSVSLEEPFWRALRGIAAKRGVSVPQLIEHVDRAREGSLSSALRVFVLAEAQSRGI